MTFNINHLKNQLINYAYACYPHEMCGLIVKKYTGETIFYQTENIHQDKNENFGISEIDYANADAMGEVIAIVHSHTDANLWNSKLSFSQADIAACNQSNMPWVLVVLPQEQIEVLNPTGIKIPLLGREFSYGILDCYSIIKDAFYEIGINLNNYPRGNLGEWIDNPDWNLYEESFEKENFVELPFASTLQKYDLLLMRTEGSKIHHAGVFWNEEKNTFVHHLTDRYSSEDFYGSYWRKVTVKKVRHESLCK